MGQQRRMGGARFAVGFSYAGEDRALVAPLAEELARRCGRQRVLFDLFHEAELARLDLDVYLPRLYRDETELIVLLLSPDDPSKSWCGLAAQPEQLPSQLLARRPTDPPGVPIEAAATSLREQAITQLQKAGGPRPLIASLLAFEALLRTLPGHSGYVNALAVLPDGQLASGADDRTIKLWDPASGEPESSQPQFVADAAITSLAFLPAPPTLVAGDASGRLHWLRLPGP